MLDTRKDIRIKRATIIAVSLGYAKNMKSAIKYLIVPARYRELSPALDTISGLFHLSPHGVGKELVLSYYQRPHLFLLKSFSVNIKRIMENMASLERRERSPKQSCQPEKGTGSSVVVMVVEGVLVLKRGLVQINLVRDNQRS